MAVANDQLGFDACARTEVKSFLDVQEDSTSEENVLSLIELVVEGVCVVMSRLRALRSDGLNSHLGWK